MTTTMTSPETASLTIRLPEVAQLLGVSLSTAHRLRVEGQLPAPIKIGRLRRYRRDEVLAWIAQGCPKQSA